MESTERLVMEYIRIESCSTGVYAMSWKGLYM